MYMVLPASVVVFFLYKIRCTPNTPPLIIQHPPIHDVCIVREGKHCWCFYQLTVHANWDTWSSLVHLSNVVLIYSWYSSSTSSIYAHGIDELMNMRREELKDLYAAYSILCEGKKGRCPEVVDACQKLLKYSNIGAFFFKSSCGDAEWA